MADLFRSIGQAAGDTLQVLAKDALLQRALQAKEDRLNTRSDYEFRRQQTAADARTESNRAWALEQTALSQEHQLAQTEADRAFEQGQYSQRHAAETAAATKSATAKRAYDIWKAQLDAANKRLISADEALSEARELGDEEQIRIASDKVDTLQVGLNNLFDNAASIGVGNPAPSTGFAGTKTDLPGSPGTTTGGKTVAPDAKAANVVFKDIAGKTGQARSDAIEKGRLLLSEHGEEGAATWSLVEKMMAGEKQGSAPGSPFLPKTTQADMLGATYSSETDPNWAVKPAGQPTGTSVLEEARKWRRQQAEDLKTQHAKTQQEKAETKQTKETREKAKSAVLNAVENLKSLQEELSNSTQKGLIKKKMELKEDQLLGQFAFIEENFKNGTFSKAQIKDLKDIFTRLRGSGMPVPYIPNISP